MSQEHYLDLTPLTHSVLSGSVKVFTCLYKDQFSPFSFLQISHGKLAKDCGVCTCLKVNDSFLMHIDWRKLSASADQSIQCLILMCISLTDLQCHKQHWQVSPETLVFEFIKRNRILEIQDKIIIDVQLIYIFSFHSFLWWIFFLCQRIVVFKVMFVEPQVKVSFLKNSMSFLWFTVFMLLSLMFSGQVQNFFDSYFCSSTNSIKKVFFPLHYEDH